jgi:hypothetical protein
MTIRFGATASYRYGHALGRGRDPLDMAFRQHPDRMKNTAAAGQRGSPLEGESDESETFTGGGFPFSAGKNPSSESPSEAAGGALQPENENFTAHGDRREREPSGHEMRR